ncbi:hypothetical protein QJS66_20665 [Kocuria rhizophila]|nr:hypothetical protein QJS66_20665 [Kocuria rhizophila]
MDELPRSSRLVQRPDRLAGQAHRGALGHRSRRLQVGNFRRSGPWNGEYRDSRARLLARRARHAGDRPASPARGPLRDGGPPPVRLGELRDRPRRLTLRDLVSCNREAQRGQRRGRRRRRVPQPLVELRGGPHGRRRGAGSAPGQQRNFLAALMLSQGTPMLLGTSWGAPKGNNRRLPGQTSWRGSTGRRLAGR